ncbi:MAG: hypothetical protein AAB567_03055 [Patescibacteria group bacterium]
MEQQNQQQIQENTEPKSATKTNWKLIGITVVLALVLGGVLISWQMQPAAPMQQTPPPPVSTPSPQPQAINNQQSTIDMSDWQTYGNKEFGFEVRYPDWLVSKEDGGTVALTSLPVSRCFSGEEDLGESHELVASFRNYTGNGFSDIWKQAFGFEFKKGNYDGVKTIDRRNAYYFYQSAEMPFARIAYLVPRSENNAIQIDTFYQNYLLNCSPKFTRTAEEVREIENQILSTFRFIE